VRQAIAERVLRKQRFEGMTMDTIFLLIGVVITLLALNHGEAGARRAAVRVD
jgi:hypothetical protein